MDWRGRGSARNSRHQAHLLPCTQAWSCRWQPQISDSRCYLLFGAFGFLALRRAGPLTGGGHAWPYLGTADGYCRRGVTCPLVPPPPIMLLTPDPIRGTFISQVFRDLRWNKKQDSIALPCSLQTKEGGAA